MSSKRSRAAFEAEIQKQESPYVYYGTPLPPLESSARDDGSFVPVWEQEVRDDRGRKRLHGAFTGGFSAGYFNTVGSKEGWTPKTFVSSRSKRNSDQAKVQRPEDFMDEEDIAEAEESKQIRTASGFTGLGGTADDQIRQEGLMDLFRPLENTVGFKLLRKMGWREGQGIGPRIRRAANGDGSHGSEVSKSQLFDPSSTKMVSFERKDDLKGLGYAASSSAMYAQAGSTRLKKPMSGVGRGITKQFNAESFSTTEKRGGFGLGVLNDTGSDDENPYEIGPRSLYNRSIGVEKKVQKAKSMKLARTGTANPQVAIKPTFVKVGREGSTLTKEIRHETSKGQAVLGDFVKAARQTTGANLYPPPKIPNGWVSKFASRKAVSDSTTHQQFKSATEAAKSSGLKPVDRAFLLGEQELPGKSVFDFLSQAARARLANASGRTDLPPARNELLLSTEKETTSASELRKQIPALDHAVASAALARMKEPSLRGSAPYSDDKVKQGRYQTFLELNAGVSEAMPERREGISETDFLSEMTEFVQAAKIFRSVGGVMAGRFAPSSSTNHSTGDRERDQMPSPTTAKKLDPAEEAARLGMYGTLTRSVSPFYPTRLMCKRFNVPPPSQTQSFGGQEDATNKESSGSVGDHDNAGYTRSSSSLQSLSRVNITRTRAGASIDEDHSSVRDLSGDFVQTSALSQRQPALIDVETNEALEATRPGEEIFRAIFGSDDGDDDD